ncbi:MAG: MFS transporter, partial [Bacteroidales bacterium]|nr:MFS transporter [Bacteroidales bacterium]
MINQKAGSSLWDLPRVRIIALCFIVQNCGMGLVMGSFGPLVKFNEVHFDISRTMAAAGMSMITLSIGVLSPFAGIFLQKYPARFLLAGALCVTGLAYIGIAGTQTYSVAMLLYLVAGAGVCLASILGPVTIISRWFVSNRAKVLSIVNLPLFLFLTPFVIGMVAPSLGRFNTLVGIGVVLILLSPLALLIADRPPTQAGDAGGASKGRADPKQLMSNRDIFTDFRFWVISVAIGVIAGSGTAYVVHIVPHGLEIGMSLQTATLLLSLYSVAGIVGTLLFGWVADKIGAIPSLIMTGLVQAVCWSLIAYNTGMVLLAVSALFGMCLLPLITLHGEALTRLYGAD